MIRPHIPTALRQLVTARAKYTCEYCLVHEDDRPESHQIDHVIALKHGGQTTEENLALACALCNNQKGSDLATIDLETEKIVPLFNPRKDAWIDHFQLSEAEIVGISTVGQATVRLLRLNEPDRVLFFIPQISPKILTCSPVLVPDETKIKGQKGRKGHPGQGGSRFGGSDEEISVTFHATQDLPRFPGASRIPN